MNLYCYNLLLKTIQPLLLKLLEKRAKKAGGDWGVRSPERFGEYAFVPLATPEADDADFDINPRHFVFERPVWVHAVSLGETRACFPLVRLLLDQGYPILLTHMTATGREHGARQFAEDIAAGRLVQAWVPYDLPHAVRGFLTHWQPRCGILIEREVWPNLVREAKNRQIPMILASARFSESSLKQTRLLGSVLSQAYKALDIVLAQSHSDAQRLQRLGITHLDVVGNLKFDLNIPHVQLEMAKQLNADLHRPVIAITSTREGEEDMFMHALLANPPSSLTSPLYVIVPRHPQRFIDVQNLLDKTGLTYVKRSDNPDAEQLNQAQVMIGDTIGEIFFYYGLADIAIVAGSFGHFGGQNHIEACAVGVPVIVGPHTHNFEKSVEDAIVEGAARRTANAAQALQLANTLLQDPQALHTMGQAGQQWLSLHQGVSQRIFKQIRSYLN